MFTVKRGIDFLYKSRHTFRFQRKAILNLEIDYIFYKSFLKTIDRKSTCRMTSNTSMVIQ